MILYIFFYFLFISSHCIYIISSTPKMSVSYLYFRLACLSNIINELFPFKYPIICDTEYFGDISTSMCTWSGHSSASIMFIPFLYHNSPMSFLNCLYITCLLYFCAKTIWYLHLQLVCDKVFLSMITSLFNCACDYHNYTLRRFSWCLKLKLNSSTCIAGGLLFHSHSFVQLT